jgi:hypothetical protein
VTQRLCRSAADALTLKRARTVYSHILTFPSPPTYSCSPTHLRTSPIRPLAHPPSLPTHSSLTPPTHPPPNLLILPVAPPAQTCDIKCPSQNIDWVVPEGGGGPAYSGM